MKAEDLKEGAVLQSRTSKATRMIGGFRPADTAKRTPRTWLVNNNWLNYAQIDARYTLPTAAQKARKPIRKAAVV